MDIMCDVGGGGGGISNVTRRCSGGRNTTSEVLVRRGRGSCILNLNITIAAQFALGEDPSLAGICPKKVRKGETEGTPVEVAIAAATYASASTASAPIVASEDYSVADQETAELLCPAVSTSAPSSTSSAEVLTPDARVNAARCFF